jgi:putative flippase GtrA
MKAPGFLSRWLRFNAVGAIGIVVQTGALGVFRSVLGVPLLAATALAVETAVLHNFVWHEHWTWKDRTASHRGALGRLVRFNLSNGLISIAVNLLFMRVLAGRFHLPYMAANFVGIAAGSLANYLASDKLVFGKERPANGTTPGPDSRRPRLALRRRSRVRRVPQNG